MQMKSRYDVIAVAKKPPLGPVVTRPAITHFLGFQLMTDPSLSWCNAYIMRYAHYLAN